MCDFIKNIHLFKELNKKYIIIILIDRVFTLFLSSLPNQLTHSYLNNFPLCFVLLLFFYINSSYDSISYLQEQK